MNITRHLPLLCTLALATIGCCVVVSAADNPVTDVHQLTLQWTSLAHQRDVLQSTWRSDEPILQQQLALLEREIEALSAVLADSEQDQDQVEQRRLELLDQQSRFELEQVGLEQSLAQATITVFSMYPQLPPPLMQSWAETLPRLEDPLLTPSEHLQIVLELLATLDDFGQKISLNETVMTLEDGQNYLVKQVYVGLSHGWYVSVDESRAAAGTATPSGWLWQNSEDAAAISSMIAMLERRQNAELVTLQVQLNRPDGQ